MRLDIRCVWCPRSRLAVRERPGIGGAAAQGAQTSLIPASPDDSGKRQAASLSLVHALCIPVRNLRSAAFHEKLLHRIHEVAGLFHERGCIGKGDGLAAIVGNETHFMRPVEQPAHLHGYMTGLDHLLTKSSDEAAVSSRRNRIKLGTGREHRSACGIEHGVIGPIAGAVEVTLGEQQSSRDPSTLCLAQEIGCLFAAVQSGTPSRAMLCSSCGFG